MIGLPASQGGTPHTLNAVTSRMREKGVAEMKERGATTEESSTVLGLKVTRPTQARSRFYVDMGTGHHASTRKYHLAYSFGLFDKWDISVSLNSIRWTLAKHGVTIMSLQQLNRILKNSDRAIWLNEASRCESTGPWFREIPDNHNALLSKLYKLDSRRTIHRMLVQLRTINSGGHFRNTGTCLKCAQKARDWHFFTKCSLTKESTILRHHTVVEIAKTSLGWQSVREYVVGSGRVDIAAFVNGTVIFLEISVSECMGMSCPDILSIGPLIDFVQSSTSDNVCVVMSSQLWLNKLSQRVNLLALDGWILITWESQSWKGLQCKSWSHETLTRFGNLKGNALLKGCKSRGGLSMRCQRHCGLRPTSFW